ncbi:MAG: DUF6364 family protein [Cryomorphaceae bacterium]
MDKKLTLSLNQEVIEKAKLYAFSNNVSLSKLIEAYLSSLTNGKDSDGKITPLVKNLSGVIDLPEDYNERDAYSDYLTDKYK